MVNYCLIETLAAYQRNTVACSQKLIKRYRPERKVRKRREIMAIKNIVLTEEERGMILEVMREARKQEYTPEKLCQLQKILDTQYYYWWMNDMKAEEDAKDLFAKDFDAYCTGFGAYPCSAYGWALSAKYGNSFMNTAHMGHQPLVWLKDESHAKGIFFFESAMNYIDNPSDALKQFYVYCNDFEKQSD